MFHSENCTICKRNYTCPYLYDFPHGKFNLQKPERDIISQMYVAYCLFYGYRLQKNQKKAVAILKKLAEKDFAPAQYLLSNCYYHGIVVKQNFATAFSWCKKAADHRCALALKQTYQNYIEGIGTNQDYELAKEYCRISISYGNEELAFSYAEMCCSEKYGEISIKDACCYYRKAYENGFEAARERLEELHRNHIQECYESKHGKIWDESSLAMRSHEEFADYCIHNGFAYHFKAAIKHYKIALSWASKEAAAKEARKKANEENNFTNRYDRALYDYDRYFERFGLEMGGGPKTVKELEKKIENCLSLYFEKVDTKNKELFDNALTGHAWAQNNIGCLFFDSEYDMSDREEAKRWFSLAAEQGDAAAQYNLGLCYYNGYGVAVDKDEAIKWYTLAAKQGHSKAKEVLEEVKFQERQSRSYRLYEEDVYAPAGAIYGVDPPRQQEPTIWHDFRTGERLSRNENGEVVNSQGEIVSPVWWD